MWGGLEVVGEGQKKNMDIMLWGDRFPATPEPASIRDFPPLKTTSESIILGSPVLAHLPLLHQPRLQQLVLHGDKRGESGRPSRDRWGRGRQR